MEEEKDKSQNEQKEKDATRVEMETETQEDLSNDKGEEEASHILEEAGQEALDARAKTPIAMAIETFLILQVGTREQKISIVDRAITTAEDFQAVELPEKKMILRPWLTERSLGMVAGDRGVGKSWFALSLAHSITRGAKFGPWETKTPVPVLYLDGEMVSKDIQERLNTLDRSTREEKKTDFYLFSEDDTTAKGYPRVNLLEKEWREKIKEVCLRLGVRLLILDNLSSLCPGIDENKKEDWDPINTWLLDLRFSGVSVLFVHHLGKSGKQRGTSGREDNLDISITLGKPGDYTIEDGARFKVEFSKSRLRMADYSLVTDIEFQLRKKGDSVEWTVKGMKKGNKREVLRLFGEGLKQKEIGERMVLAKSQVSKIRTALVKEGLLAKDNQITPSGKAFLGED